MKTPRLSVVIRSYNEATPLERLLKNLQSQNYPQDSLQFIVVDNGSTDKTAEIIKKYKVDSVYLPQKDFNYPKSSNLGIEKATAPIVVLLSAHCLPPNYDWLNRVAKHFDNPKVAGLYGGILPMPDSPFIEKLVRYPEQFINSLRGVRIIKRVQPGILGATNCAIRKDLWSRHHFDERYGAGGEDGEWAAWALEQGYVIIFDPKFTVRHSHYQGLRDYWKQRQYWHGLLNGPRPFNKSELSFRKDLKN